MAKPRPCIQRDKTLLGDVKTWCGQRVPASRNKDTWFNYNAFTMGDTCPSCVAAREAAR